LAGRGPSKDGEIDIIYFQWIYGKPIEISTSGEII
jgi:hypothetical protein